MSGGRHRSTGRPLAVLVRSGPGAAATATCALVLAGWCELGADGSSSVSGREGGLPGFQAVTVGDPSTAGIALGVLLTGWALVAARAAGGSTHGAWSRFVRAASESARPVAWEDSPLARLDEVQLRLLAAIGEGASMGSAAARVAVSERSAHRRLQAARELLGARSNGHAASLVQQQLATFV